VFSALQDQLASLDRHAHLTRCFSAVAELPVIGRNCQCIPIPEPEEVCISKRWSSFTNCEFLGAMPLALRYERPKKIIWGGSELRPYLLAFMDQCHHIFQACPIDDILFHQIFGKFSNFRR